MLLPKRKNKKYFYRALTFNTLLPLEKIINFVKTSGIEFDPKNPKTKIFYIVKLGLLDDLINKTTKNTDLNKNSQSSLHLPYSAVDRIVQIENLHSMGLSYRKIVKIYKKLKTSSLLITSKEGNPGISYNLRRKKPHQQISILPKHLIPTTEIIEIAGKLNIDLGNSDPKERIRYLIKLGILPQTIKKMSKRSGKIAGHFPAWAVERLVYVNRLRMRGLSYPKIAEKISRIENRNNQTNVNWQNSALNLLRHQLDKRLKDHEEKIEMIVQNKLDQYLSVFSHKTAHK